MLWKPALGAAAVLAAWAAIHAYGDRREDAGRAAVKALWTADVEARDRAALEAISAVRAAEEAQRKANEVIESEYQARLSSIASDRDSVERLLREARDEIRRRTAAEATGALIAAQSSEARRLEELRRIDERIAAATADLRVEAGQNAEQLDALIAVIGPQL